MLSHLRILAVCGCILLAGAVACRLAPQAVPQTTIDNELQDRGEE
jgi:hypothetical protein